MLAGSADEPAVSQNVTVGRALLVPERLESESGQERPEAWILPESTQLRDPHPSPGRPDRASACVQIVECVMHAGERFIERAEHSKPDHQAFEIRLTECADVDLVDQSLERSDGGSAISGMLQRGAQLPDDLLTVWQRAALESAFLSRDEAHRPASQFH